MTGISAIHELLTRGSAVVAKPGLWMAERMSDGPVQRRVEALNSRIGDRQPEMNVSAARRDARAREA
jgi:hypothetical protein